jgi:trk system potassium uptake protein TrkA
MNIIVIGCGKVGSRLAEVLADDGHDIVIVDSDRNAFKLLRPDFNGVRIYNPEREHVFHQFGLETICPTNLTVDVIKSKILGEIGTSHHTIGGESFTFKRENVGKEFAGKKLSAIRIKENSLIFGVLKKGTFAFPDPNLKLERGDFVIMVKRTH